MPLEKQIHLFFGGTYGNFEHARINNFIRPLADGENILLIAMPISDYITDQEIIASYTNIKVEDVAFGPLIQMGFSKKDFKRNRDDPSLVVQIDIVDRCLVSSLVLNNTMKISDKTFDTGTVFRVTTSWKPKLNEFMEALSTDFIVDRMFHNQSMAIAMVRKSIR